MTSFKYNIISLDERPQQEYRVRSRHISAVFFPCCVRPGLIIFKKMIHDDNFLIKYRQ